MKGSDLTPETLLSSVSMSDRALAAAARAGVTTVGELAATHPERLGCGPRTFRELSNIVARTGIPAIVWESYQTKRDLAGQSLRERKETRVDEPMTVARIGRVWPAVILLWTQHHSAWIVGSAADPNKVRPRDVDVMIPWRNWPQAAAHVPKDAKPSTFGGWKFQQGGVTIDVWPDSLDRLVELARFSWAWHPATDTRICKVGLVPAEEMQPTPAVAVETHVQRLTTEDRDGNPCTPTCAHCGAAQEHCTGEVAPSRLHPVGHSPSAVQFRDAAIATAHRSTCVMCGEKGVVHLNEWMHCEDCGHVVGPPGVLVRSRP